MKTKILLPIAIIATLPFTANATQTIVQTQTPAAVTANGTVKKAGTRGPYQTVTIGEHDDEHIATTAYVKGAYNDAIAGINAKQPQLHNSDYGVDITGAVGEDTFLELLDNENLDLENVAQALITTDAAIAGIRSQRVTVYTTWDNDTDAATTLVPFATAQ